VAGCKTEKGKAEVPELRDMIDTATMRHFAEIERMRRVSDKNKQAYSAREKMQEAEEKHDMEKFHERDKNWTQEERRDDRISDWRSFQEAPDGKKAKAATFQVEKREEVKHGQAKTETWKKNWK
jgi:hypothetical protein